MRLTTNECSKEPAVAPVRRESEVEGEGELRTASALKLYKTGRISSGLAARLAGMSRVDFLLICGRHGISIFQQHPEELVADTATVSELIDCHRY